MPDLRVTYPLHAGAILPIREEDVRRKGQQLGHLRKRGEFWHVEFWKWRTMDDGALKYVQTSETTREVLKWKARRKADAIVSAANATAHCPQGVATVQQFVDLKYRPDLMGHQSISTQKLKEYLLRRHVLPSLGPIALADVNPSMIQMLITGKARAGLAPQTVGHIRNLISNIFRYAKALRFVAGERPTEGIRAPRIVHEERKALTPEQMALFAAQIREPYRTLVLLLAATGLRICEATGLRWRRLNLTDHPLIVDGETLPPWSLAVREKFSHGKYSPLLKSKAGRRDVMLTKKTAVLMLEHVQRCKPPEPNGPVFFGKTGLPLDYHNAANRVIKPAARACGLGWVSFHVLRHTAETLADKAGLTMGERMQMFGQASGEMIQRYTHREAEDVRKKLEGVN